MRLVYTIPDYWPHVRRGSERVVHDLGVLMVGAGHSVTVVTRTPKSRPENVDDAGVRVRYRPSPQFLPRLVGLRPIEAFALVAAKAAIGAGADLFHTFHMSDAYALTRMIPLHRRPVIFSYHGIPGRRWLSENEPRLERWFTHTVRTIDCVTVMTQMSAQRLRDEYGRDPVVLTPGIFVDDFARNRVPPDDPTIVCAAAVDDPRKRINVLLDAFEIAAARNDRLRLWLVGYGDDSLVRHRMASMPERISSRVRVEPVVDVASAYSRSTVGVLTSISEAFGLVVAEYLASGMPAVVSADGGSPEVLGPGTGFAVPVDDPSAFARGLLEAVELAAMPGTANACRERARAFDWSTRIGAYRDLYQSLMR